MDSPKQSDFIDPKLKIALWVAISVIVVGLVLPLNVNKTALIPILTRLLALLGAVAIPLFLGRKRLILLAVWLAVYLIAYGFLSWHGAYIGANHGGKDNRDTWYPAHCGEAYRSRSGRQKSTLLPLGWFFLPLVVTDRWFIHHTKLDAA